MVAPSARGGGPLGWEVGPTGALAWQVCANAARFIRGVLLVVIGALGTVALSQPQVPLQASEPSGVVSLDERGRLVRGGRAYVPSGFSADYRTRWELWEPLLDGMAAQYADPVVRFNLAGAARGGLVLHADVAPGLINPQAAANLLRLVEMFRARGVGYWIVWLHRGQERMLRYVRGHPAYRGTLLSTGDGTAVVRGQVATHAVAGADVFNAHLHPQPGDDKPKIVSIVESGAPWGIYHHTQHPALAHVVAAPYWNGALGYGQVVSRLYSAEDFGEVRTRLDRHAIAEYVFSGNLGTGMPWDHEGHLVTFGAVARYAEVIDFYREHAIVDERELDLRPAWRDHRDVVGLYLIGEDRTLAYVFSKAHWDDEEAARGTYRIEVPSAWGDVSLEVQVGDRSLFRVSEP